MISRRQPTCYFGGRLPSQIRSLITNNKLHTDTAYLTTSLSSSALGTSKGEKKCFNINTSLFMITQHHLRQRSALLARSFSPVRSPSLAFSVGRVLPANPKLLDRSEFSADRLSAVYIRFLCLHSRHTSKRMGSLAFSQRKALTLLGINTKDIWLPN